MSLPTLSLVGTGAVARAVGRVHVDAGGRVVRVASRSADRAAALAARLATTPAAGEAELFAADVVIVAVSDRAVPEVGARLARCADGARTPVLHTSGALAGSALTAGARSAGGSGPEALVAGSLHPLQSFPRGGSEDAADDARLAAGVAGCHWFHEGAGEDVARELVAAWGGVFHTLAPGAKVLYHAAAAIVSNHTVALFDAATQLMSAAGVDVSDAVAPLASLLAGTQQNIAAQGPLTALTGPVARGDVETVERHVDALRRAAPHLVGSYVETALLAVDVAVRRGSLDGTTERRLRAALGR